MADDMARHGGSVTRRPRRVQPARAPPVRRAVGDWDLAVNPPPSVGGPMLAVMLGELGAAGNFSWADVIEIQRAVLRYRADVHDVAPTSTPRATSCCSPSTATGWPACRRARARRTSRSSTPTARPAPVTVSSGYGAESRCRAPASCSTTPSASPSSTGSGCTGSLPAPAASNMAPTTGARRRPGARDRLPGADRITTALMQVLGQGCLHDADLQHAIDAPGCTCGSPDGVPVVEHETDAAIARAVADAGLRGSTTA